MEEEAQKPEANTWQKRTKRQVGIDRSFKVGIDVKVLPEVREEINALAISHGMSPQRYIERLIVDTINHNPEHVEAGLKYLQRTKGNVRLALALVHDERLCGIGAESPPISNRSR